ncbi:serine hydrolase domain-containing protein [Cellvibrio fibrivorans]|uniref:Beta-lactamase class C n=1 Tax=Cellvibrio fibrivorans TaxID=126350 RepID=A0ABU1V1V9_9GAMM|nr:serine hydrolase domain-containing protein [Cellvibrio fibrivorans]MDR7091441.1 beta-lactamase class C [Cellvibrio fibrivorans]
MRSTISSNLHTWGRLAAAAALSLLIMAPLVQASGEKRVTVPIALPFQQATSLSSSSVAATTAAALPNPNAIQPMPYTQAPAPAVVALYSSAAYSSAEALSSAVQVANVSSVATSSAAPAVKAAVAKEARPAAVNIPVVTTAPIKAPRYPVGHPEAFVPEFEDYIAKKVAPFVPGVAVVIVSGGQIKSLNGYGVRRAGTRETITPDTVFRLASLSKAVAATSASVLVNEGKISWDTTVTSVLPNITFSNARYGKQLTLRHALSQSSGLPRHTYSHFIDANKSYADSVARLRYVNFVCPPGKCFAYQNVMYSLSGDMIKNKAGMSFEQYTEEKIFDPLGMRSASYGLASYNASPNRAAPHVNNGKRWIPTAVTGNWYRVAPAAGVNASIVDMSRFLLAQMGKRQDVLPLSVLNPIQSRVTKNTPAQNYYGVRKAVGNTAYGMGWRVFDYGRNKNFIHHGGHVKGFRTEMVFNRDLQIGMVFLSNSETRLARDVIFKFLDSYERAQTAARGAAKKKK